MPTVKNISDYIDSFAPYVTKCEWDNCGILIGDRNRKIHKIGFTLDLTPETLNNAVSEGVQLVVTHHPVIFHAQKSFLSGNIAFEAAKSGVDVISAHTCFDCADGGVNDVLFEVLGLFDAEKVESAETVKPMARIGKISCVSPRKLAVLVSRKLDTTVRLVDGGKNIEKVAVCGGAGMCFLDDVIAAGADAFVTGEIRHNEMLEAKQKGVTVIAAGHFETEYPAMSALKKKVQEHFPDTECILIKQSNPIEFIKE
ncbi:MAG: Nif3-like dinuclear metal center hexameric protein [Acutalibacteraceae bacterium]